MKVENVMKTPWLSLLLAVVHACAGLLVLIVSSWFIAASSVAGLQFNYMLPAVVIRGLALTRIASGYANMWLGHRDLLDRTGVLRTRLFAQLRDRIIATRATGVEALANDTETVAAIYVAWAGHQASAIAMLVAALGVSVWFALDGIVAFILLTCVWVIIATLTAWHGLKVALSQAQCDADFRFDSEHFFASSSIWNLIQRANTTSEVASSIPAPSARKVWQAEQRQQLNAQHGLWVLQSIAFLLLMVVLASADATVISQPLAVIIPMLLLASGDWLGRSLLTWPSYSRFKHSQQALHSITTETITPLHEPNLMQSIDLIGFAPLNRSVKTINETLPNKGLVVLAGSSGSGKSSLLQALAGLIPFTGERLVDEVRTEQGLFENWLYVDQKPHILQATLRANLCLSEKTIDDQHINAVLQELGLAHFTKFDEWLGVGGRKPSGGESKRLTLARALLAQPRVLLVDEPFEGLDEQATRLTLDTLEAYAHNQLVIIATHIFPPELVADKQITLD